VKEGLEMENDKSESTKTFKELEQEGWEIRADSYDYYSSPVTSQAVDALLEAVDARRGLQLLDVATGTGLVAGKAASRGIVATGIDFASSMISVAKRNYPQAQFDIDDAETLSFEDASFDVVVCQFGLNHMADPDAAIAESYRVLKSGGKFGFTVWNTPDKSKFFEIILGAVQTHGILEIPLPPAPPISKFSDHGECQRALEVCGFMNVRVIDVPIVVEITPLGILDIIYKGTVRISMVLEAQTEEARKKIHEAIVEGAKQLEPASGDIVRIPMPAVLVSAQKP
jgi:ubiquinone/menaquinone biosynthesis C-methylase UbiE